VGGGWHWWGSEEQDFRTRLGWSSGPDIELSTRVAGSQRILELTLGKKMFDGANQVPLVPDHGKLLHLFLIREGSADAIAHIHPVHKTGKTFQVALPPLPAGRYKVFCDLTLRWWGMSFTATSTVELPPIPAASASKDALIPDADDSWASYDQASVPPAAAANQVYDLPGGLRVVWKAHGPLRANQDAGLQFEVLDGAGKPADLEPYMGMLSHAAVMRRDGKVFAHLHPSGNYSMAAQHYFMAKMAKETKGTGKDDAMAGMPGMEGMAGMAGMDHSKMGGMMHEGESGHGGLISLPYEFPSPGEYRIWVQFKTGGRVLTGVFDAVVGS
jgi:hypothetical protein